MTEDQLRFPIGRFKAPTQFDKEDVVKYINTIEAFPQQLRALVSSLSDSDLERRYRTDGWTIRQVVHHVADSHLNSYIRFKWTLTEDLPVIKPYDQDGWAQCTDALQAPVSLSLDLLEALHARWVYVLRSLSDAEWQRRLFHPEQGRELTLWWLAAMYAWHCQHHLAHVRLALGVQSQE